MSAIKVDGQRAYKRVRAGEDVELPARPVTVSRFDVGTLRPADGGAVDVDVHVVCSSGTYVRALARDLGAALGVGGHLTVLRRTRVGPYGLDVAHTLEALAEDVVLLPIEDCGAGSVRGAGRRRGGRGRHLARWAAAGHRRRRSGRGVRPRRRVPRARRGPRRRHEGARGLRLTVQSMRFSMVSSSTTSKPALR